MSEKMVGQTFESIFDQGTDEILYYYSHQIYTGSNRFLMRLLSTEERFAFQGRSMSNAAAVAMELGYLTVPLKTLIDIEQIDNLHDDEVVVITTGTQGEPMSALTRMANRRTLKTGNCAGDLVVISAYADTFERKTGLQSCEPVVQQRG